MTVLKTSALAVAIVAAMAFGVVMRPYLVHDRPAAPPVTTTASAATTAAAHPMKSSRAVPPRLENVTVTPPLEALEKPLLKSGTNMTLAAAGFTRAEDFAAVAHASNNLDIPFVLLKYRLLDQHMPLARAIHESRPDVSGDVEADRARAEARSDVVATIKGVV